MAVFVACVSVGLRTLCIATAVIPSDEYAAWKKTYYEASTAIIGREELLADAAELIEKVNWNLCYHVVVRARCTTVPGRQFLIISCPRNVYGLCWPSSC